MQKFFHVTFIPVWLENTMARTGMNFSDALCVEKLSGIVSKSDLVFYTLANDCFWENYVKPNPCQWLISNNLKDKFSDDFFWNNYSYEKDTISKIGLSDSEKFLRFAFGETASIDALKNKDFVLQATLIDDKNIVVTLRFSEAKIEPYKFFGNFYEQLLKILNDAIPFQSLASCKMFKTYNRYIALGVTQ